MTRRALVLLVAAVGVVVAVVAQPSPAHAQADLDVVVGYGDGFFTPGEPVPVRVRIDSDRLLRGELEVGIDEAGSDNPPTTVPIEVSGGSNEVVVVALPTPAGATRLTITVNVPGLGLAREVDVRYEPRIELVGLVPDLVTRAPDPLTLPGELGRALFDVLDNRTLATPGALDPLGTIVTGPDGLGPLSGAARANVLDWLDRGGRLVVDAAPGGEVAGLPAEWQPGDATSLPAGRGEVALADGGVAAGRWDEVIRPTALVLPGSSGPSVFFGSEGVAQTVGRDGGLRVPSVGWLGLFLALYVVVVGPLVFVALRRLRRGSWTWLAVPLVAVVFATGAFVVGADLRSGAQASHGTVVHTGPSGARSTSYVALVSRSGEDGRATFPQGWLAAGLGNTGRGGPMNPDPRASAQVEPAAVHQAPDGTSGEVALDPGGVGMVYGWGSIDPVGGLEVTAEALADGTVTGTVTNTTDVTLHDVLVMVGYTAWDGDSLAPGAQAEWSVEYDANAVADVMFRGGVPEEPWQHASGWDQQVPDDTPINYALWNEVMSGMADPYPTGLAVAAGWTRDWEPTIDVGRDLERGRTAFVTDAPVRSADGQPATAAARRELLRIGEPSEGTRPPEIPEEFDFTGQGAVETITRHTLAGAADGPVRLTLPASVVAAQVWDGTRWVALARLDDSGRPVDDTDMDVTSFDPWNPDQRTTADLPAAAVQDGVVLVRTHGVNLEMGITDMPVVGPAG